MTPFPQLSAEQAELADVLGQWRPELAADAKGRVGQDVCRRLTCITQVREEIVYPACVGRAPARMLDAFTIEEDWIRVLVAEIVESGPRGLLYGGLIDALKEAVARRWAAEERPGGLWSHVSGADLERIDVAIGERLRDLDLASRSGDWTPLLPTSLETVRPSVPPGATRWTDL